MLPRWNTQIVLLMDPSVRKAEQMITQVRKLKDSDDYYKRDGTA